MAVNVDTHILEPTTMPPPDWFTDATRHLIDLSCAAYLCDDETDASKTLLRGLNYFSRMSRENEGTGDHWLVLTVALARVIQESDPGLFKTNGTNDMLGIQAIDNTTGAPISNPDARAAEDKDVAAHLAAMRFIVADANQDRDTAIAVFEAAMLNGTARMMISTVTMMAGARMVERLYRDKMLPPEKMAILDRRHLEEGS